MEIRRQFAQVIANKLVPSGQAAEGQVNKVKDLVEQVGQEIPTQAGDQVELQFERVSQALTSGKSLESAEVDKLKQEAQPAIDAFGNSFIFGYGSVQNTDFQSYGDGMFSFKGGNLAQPNITFMVDTSPQQDGMQWMVLDNSKLPK